MSYLRPSGDAERDVDAVEAWLSAADPAPVVLATSGSSGAPKQVVLGRDAVLASAGASAARIGGNGPWVLALPSSYVAGFNVLVRSLGRGGFGEVWEAIAPGGVRVALKFIRLDGDHSGPERRALGRQCE